MIGLLASVIGLVARLGIAKGMIAAVRRRSGVDLPKAATVVAPRTIIVVARSLGTGDHAARQHPARRAGPRACRRSRRSARARRCRRRGSPAHSAKPGIGVAIGLAGRDLAGIFAGGVSGAAVGAAARRRRARAVRRHRAARPAARQAARPRRRLAGAPRRRRRRRAGRRQRGPQPRPHGVDRRRADDRAHARHASSRCSAPACARRPRTAVSDQIHADYVVDGKRRAAVPGRRGRRAGERSPGVRPPRTSAPTRRSCRARRTRHRHRPGHDRALLHVRLADGLRAARSAGSAPTARS